MDDARRAVGEEDHYGEEDNTPEAQAELVRGPEPARWLVAWARGPTPVTTRPGTTTARTCTADKLTLKPTTKVTPKTGIKAPSAPSTA